MKNDRLQRMNVVGAGPRACPNYKVGAGLPRPYKGQPRGVAPTILFFVFYLLFSSFCSLSSQSHASEISVSARIDKSKLSIDDTLTLTMVIEGETRSLPAPELPAIEGFRTYSSSRSQNISIVNGEIFASVTFRFILVPQKIGKFTIPSIQIGYKGKIYETDPIEVEVMDVSAGRVSRQAPSSSSPPVSTEEGVKKLFIQTYVDKLRPYVNEQVTLTFAFHRSIDLFENPEYEPPATVGFWSEDMPPQNQYFKKIDGRTYHVTEIKTALFPTTAGDLTISPARLKVVVPQQSEDFFSMDPFDIFRSGPFSIAGRGKTITLATQPITLQAQPLPEENRPADFKGDIGDYQLTVKADKEQLETNQPVNVVMEVSGQGNIKTITSPVIALPQGFKNYEGGGSEEISKDGYVVQGKKIFEQVLIPTIPGKFKIPAQYHFFSPSRQKYITLTSNPIVIEVKPSGKEESLVGISSSGIAAPKSEVRRIGEDIRFIKTTVPALHDQGALPWDMPYFWWAHTFPWFLWGLFYGWQRRRMRLNQDVVYARQERAHSIAQKRLRQAKNRMNAGDPRGFYEEIQKALHTFILDRLGIATMSLPMDGIIGELQNRSLPEEELKRLRILLEECDLARFAPSQLGAEQMKNSFKEAETMIEQLERARRKKTSLLTIGIFFLLLAGAQPLSWGSTSQELFDQANTAYESQKYEESINGYRQLLQQGIRHGTVYYNLGNAYLKNGSRGNAVLSYERGLRLQPRDRDIKANLDYVQREINTAGKLQTQTKGFAERVAETLTGWVSQRELARGLLTFYWAFVVFLFLWTAWVSRRRQFKPWLIFALTTWLLSLGMTGLKSYDLNQPTAVVLEKEIVLRAGPGEDFAAQAAVPEGTQIRILRYTKGWLEVRLGELQGWILQNSAERI